MIGSAWAHHPMEFGLPATLAEGLLSGLGHPLIGVDHFAFILAAGFFLALVNGGIWGIVALIIGSLLGAGVHLQGFDLPSGGIAVALSVILIGVLVAARRPIGIGWMCAGLVLAGMVHGYAYAESIMGAERTPLVAYLIGFSLIQFGVATAAFVFHRKQYEKTKTLSPALGAIIGMIGVTFLFV